jgi:hypothetical protein
LFWNEHTQARSCVPGPQHLDEEFEQVALGDEAHQLSIAHYRQAADLVVGHNDGKGIFGHYLVYQHFDFLLFAILF